MQLKPLTNSTTKHNYGINVLKMNSDYTKVYSVDNFGNMKIWGFNLTDLQFKQLINVGPFVSWYMAEALFVWNNGAKIFMGTCNPSVVKIYTLNTGNDTYS
jgi:hypothetical protein